MWSCLQSEQAELVCLFCFLFLFSVLVFHGHGFRLYFCYTEVHSSIVTMIVT